MSTNFYEQDIEVMVPGAYENIKRLSKVGTSGIVFFAIERASGRKVAIKISRAEDGTIRSLRAEAAALDNPAIACHPCSGTEIAELDVVDFTQEAEQDICMCEPTARRLYSRLQTQLSNRVGLVMEWLEKLRTLEPGIHASTLRSRRRKASETIEIAITAHSENSAWKRQSQFKAEDLAIPSRSRNPASVRSFPHSEKANIK